MHHLSFRRLLPVLAALLALGLAAAPAQALTVHFRGLPPREPHPWVMATFVSRTAAGGVVEEDGELWSADGRLLVQSRQLSVMRRRAT